ncbi:MAG: acyl carrier protein [Acidobacteria bacterium]|nr:acyl carrier protein [Acidobacteriota bacterium]
MKDINSEIKQFILKEFLPGEDPNNLTDSTPLIDNGILDSLAILQLVSFLEKEYGIHIEPHETDEEFLGSIVTIESLVRSKLP